MVKLTDKQLDMGNLAKFNSRHVTARHGVGWAAGTRRAQGSAPAGRPGLCGRKARAGWAPRALRAHGLDGGCAPRTGRAQGSAAAARPGLGGRRAQRRLRAPP